MSDDEVEEIECIKQVQRGIRGRKFHYAKGKSKECRILLTNNCKELQWLYGKGNDKAYVIGRCAVEQILGFNYGSLSTTFMKYNDEILDLIDRGEPLPFYAW